MAAAIQDREQLLGIGAAARALGFGEQWVRILCDRGDLPAIRDSGGRRLIATAAVQKFLEKRKGHASK